MPTLGKSVSPTHMSALTATLPVTPTLPFPDNTLPTGEAFNPLGLVGCKFAAKQSGNFSPPHPPEICVYDFPFPFQRPIDSGGRSEIESSYRYGSTQNSKRAPHHGVDMINKAGVPVLAAADGKVVVAGNDLEEIYATHANFYGNLVVLEHSLAAFDHPVYTLYGHLLKVKVKNGQRVKAGQQVGEVGVGGVAAGTHLHFEVRMGNNAYNATRNPELWLTPLVDKGGESMGVLAGRFLDKKGNFLEIEDITLRPLDVKDNPTGNYIYLSTYQDRDMMGQPPFLESFAAGGLLPGLYRMVFIHGRPIEFTAEVMPGKITLLTFLLD